MSFLLLTIELSKIGSFLKWRRKAYWSWFSIWPKKLSRNIELQLQDFWASSFCIALNTVLKNYSMMSWSTPQLTSWPWWTLSKQIETRRRNFLSVFCMCAKGIQIYSATQNSTAKSILLWFNIKMMSGFRFFRRYWYTVSISLSIMCLGIQNTYSWQSEAASTSC